MTQSRNGRAFECTTPSAKDIVRASELPLLTACPRRYCWWWKTLAFDWETPVIEGCTYLNETKPLHWVGMDKPCCRSDANSNIDHYEPREPHLEADGFDRYRFCGPQNHQPEIESTDA